MQPENRQLSLAQMTACGAQDSNASVLPACNGVCTRQLRLARKPQLCFLCSNAAAAAAAKPLTHVAGAQRRPHHQAAQLA